MDLWHSNNMKVILHEFAKDQCFWTLWTLNYADLSFVLILSMWLTIRPNNLKKFYVQISKKHQISIFEEGFL